MVRRLVLRLFVGGERFLAAIGLGVRGSVFPAAPSGCELLAQAFLAISLGIAGGCSSAEGFSLPSIGLGVRGVGFSGSARFSLGCFSLILPSLGQQTLTKNAHGASRRIEFGYAGRFANRGFWAGRRGCLTRIRTRRLLGRRRSGHRNRRAPAAWF